MGGGVGEGLIGSSTSSLGMYYTSRYVCRHDTTEQQPLYCMYVVIMTLSLATRKWSEDPDTLLTELSWPTLTTRRRVLCLRTHMYVTEFYRMNPSFQALFSPHTHLQVCVCQLCSCPLHKLIARTNYQQHSLSVGILSQKKLWVLTASRGN